jgi:hypothetical protein
LLLLSLSFQTLTLAQSHVNREWVETFGEPLDLEWSKSINGIDNQLIHVGNIATINQGANISTTVYYNDGSIKWQSNYHSINQNNDYGISVALDQNENVYVLGTTDNQNNIDYDILLLKYSSTGSLQWSQTFGSNYDLNDIGTELILDDAGESIYICASSESASNNYDFLTLKYNSDGVYQWDERYDYDDLIEIPIGIEFDNNGDLFVTGTSGSSTNRWDYTIVKYTINGTYIGDERNSMPGIGFDQPLAFTKDSFNNIYVTGRSSTDGVNYDIKTIKIDESYNLQWSKTYDFEGKEDAGSTIRVDTNGNVYIGGYVTRLDDVNIYRYDATVHHGSEINSIDTVVAYWARPSSSEVLEPVYNDSLLPRERVQIEYLDRDSCVMHGYVYELLDNSGISMGWLPRDTLTLRPDLEYTILSRDSTTPVANIDSHSNFNQKISLYPNPTNNIHKLELSGFAKKNTIVVLYDIQGRKISTIHNGIIDSKKQTLDIDVSHLNAGLYFYTIYSENIRKDIRFIKQ